MCHCFKKKRQSQENWELMRKKTHEVLFVKCIVCHCRSKNVLQNRLCGLETKQSPLNIIMEKLPEENTKKDIVVNLWLVCKKPVRDYRRGCWMVQNAKIVNHWGLTPSNNTVNKFCKYYFIAYLCDQSRFFVLFSCF